MSLFLPGPIKSHSGVTLPDKIDCDALTPVDWAICAKWFATRLPPFSHVVGIPRGGMKLANLMEAFIFTDSPPVLLICDDVITTGNSMNEYRNNHSSFESIIGIALISRMTNLPAWIKVRFMECS